MNKLILVLLFVAVAFAKVTDITKSFDDSLAQNEWALVKFFAPWCGHCRTLGPKFEKLSKMTDALVAEVDCTVDRKLCQAHNVRGYPTINLFHNGKLVEAYKGRREPQPMLDWLQGHM